MNEKDFEMLLERMDILEKSLKGKIGFPLDPLMKGAIENSNFATLKAINMITNRMPLDLTASRAKDTVYLNGSNNSILVMATFRCLITVAAGNAYVQAKSDSLAAPTTVVSGKVGIEAGLLNEDNTFQIVFIVSAGAYYNIVSAVTNGTVTLGRWMETPI